ncbi:MAG: enoyl-CoA hydratase/isomerase family protein [Acidobacteria bacterium]|nr:enoyl-CoA hydratase/isomerase family protein [Acidobacteriota bacterium]
MLPVTEHFILEEREHCQIVHLISSDGINRLTRERLRDLITLFESGLDHAKPLIFAGNENFFSSGADLNEIAALGSPDALEFATHGQRLMRLVDDFPHAVYAAVSGYCLGGGLDLALACDQRVCSANAVLGHRGAALGLITGWGGTQRLARLVGRARALQMFVAAEKLGAADALDAGLVSEIAPEALARCIDLAERRASTMSAVWYSS